MNSTISSITCAIEIALTDAGWYDAPIQQGNLARTKLHCFLIERLMCVVASNTGLHLRLVVR